MTQKTNADIDNFNPRSREGSDPDDPDKDKDGEISIHAPAKGATAVLCTQTDCHFHFNPRSREGSDYATPRLYSYINRFQSTLPRRERPYAV